MVSAKPIDADLGGAASPESPPPGINPQQLGNIKG
jgi:hypothetical protein